MPEASFVQIVLSGNFLQDPLNVASTRLPQPPVRTSGRQIISPLVPISLRRRRALLLINKREIYSIDKVSKCGDCLGRVPYTVAFVWIASGRILGHDREKGGPDVSGALVFRKGGVDPPV